jgi:beta-glucosidase
VYITENGLSNQDWIALDGKVHDSQRIDFLHRYLRELKRACADGVDVRGYFQWSIMDNFEWAEGYKERFGLVYVDYPTQRRIPKDSAYWYQSVIESNGGCL